jgi:branched-chain amino acid transport system ATP-binding protein
VSTDTDEATGTETEGTAESDVADGADGGSADASREGVGSKDGAERPTGSEEEYTLSVDGLTKRFGGLTAVDDLSFGVRENEILGFIGPNGAGKSTVFNCIMGVYAPSEGQVHLHGEDVTGEDTHAIVNRGLARVSQESNPIPDRIGAENIRIFTLPNSLRSFRGGASREEIERVAATVGIEDQLDVLPGSMAHADTRRLEIAKAIATDPDTLLLDEPFAGMNQAEIRDLSDQIRSFREEGITIVVVDHNMKGLMALVDRVIVLNEGAKLAEGAPEAMANDERVQQAYLAGSETGFETDRESGTGRDTDTRTEAASGPGDPETETEAGAGTRTDVETSTDTPDTRGGDR